MEGVLHSRNGEGGIQPGRFGGRVGGGGVSAGRREDMDGGVERNSVREFGRQENGREERDQAVERWQISVIRNSARANFAICDSRVCEFGNSAVATRKRANSRFAGLTSRESDSALLRVGRWKGGVVRRNGKVGEGEFAGDGSEGGND